MAAELRLAREGDAEWVVAAHGRIYGPEFGLDDGFERDIADKLAAFQAKDDPFKRLWIAADGDRRLGSTAISTLAPDTAFLNFVLVEPEGRGQGLAGMMMDAALGHARNAGITSVRLETYSLLTDARALYARRGFEIAEVTPGLSKYGRTFDREYWLLTL